MPWGRGGGYYNGEFTIEMTVHKFRKKIDPLPSTQITRERVKCYF
jgi:hypothetical protein